METMDCELCEQSFIYDPEEDVAICEHCGWANTID